MVIFAIVLIQAAPAQDETIVDDIAANEEAFVMSPGEQENFLKLLKLKKLLLFG